MAYASSYSITKTALITLLNARPALADVAVGYDPPTSAEDLRSRGSNEAIYFGPAEGAWSDEILCAGDLRFDEQLSVTLIVQVLRPDSEGTQQVADTRVDELLYEVLDEVSGQGDWDMEALGLDVFDYFQVTPRGYRRAPGFLSPEGHADRVEIDLLVQTRRSFP